MATSTKTEFEKFRDIRDHQEFSEHLAVVNARRALEDEAADLYSRRVEFVDRVNVNPPRREQVIEISETLLADITTALRKNIAARDAFNVQLDEVAGEARALGMTDDRTAAVTWITTGADRGLHLAGKRVERAVGWRHAAEQIAANSINLVVRTTR